MRYLLILVITNLSFCGTKELSKECNPFHEGTFKLMSEYTDNTIITRNKTKQTEKNYDNGSIVELDINWLNDCTYQLSNSKIIKGEDWLKGALTDTLTFEIIEINNDIITVEASANFSDFKYSTKMKKLK